MASEKDKPGALELLGILMVHGDEYDTGRKYLEQADAAGRNVDRELGRAYLRTGKVDDAKVRLTRHLATAPEDYDALADLGDVYYQQGAYDDAVKNLNKAVELHPYIPKVEQSLARALDKAGKTGAGFYHLGHAAEFQGDRMAALGYYQKALERLSTGDPLHAKAKKQLETLEKEKPRFPMPPRPRGGGGGP
jgi:tetratricopeptide (TPR) repeat protein